VGNKASRLADSPPIFEPARRGAFASWRACLRSWVSFSSSPLRFNAPMDSANLAHGRLEERVDCSPQLFAARTHWGPSPTDPSFFGRIAPDGQLGRCVWVDNSPICCSVLGLGTRCFLEWLLADTLQDRLIVRSHGCPLCVAADASIEFPASVNGRRSVPHRGQSSPAGVAPGPPLPARRRPGALFSGTDARLHRRGSARESCGTLVYSNGRRRR
jgi:hypothetical protein